MCCQKVKPMDISDDEEEEEEKEDKKEKDDKKDDKKEEKKEKADDVEEEEELDFGGDEDTYPGPGYIGGYWPNPEAQNKSCQLQRFLITQRWSPKVTLYYFNSVQYVYMFQKMFKAPNVK